MENENERALSQENATPDALGERLTAIAEKNGQTLDELLTCLEEERPPKDGHIPGADRSTGSLAGGGFDADPAGTEFLKGIWGK